jgi:hypothetical protein
LAPSRRLVALRPGESILVYRLPTRKHYLHGGRRKMRRRVSARTHDTGYPRIYLRLQGLQTFVTWTIQLHPTQKCPSQRLQENTMLPLRKVRASPPPLPPPNGFFRARASADPDSCNSLWKYLYILPSTCTFAVTKFCNRLATRALFSPQSQRCTWIPCGYKPFVTALRQRADSVAATCPSSGYKQSCQLANAAPTTAPPAAPPVQSAPGPLR